MANTTQSTLLEAAVPTVEAWVDGSCPNNGDPDAVAGVGAVIVCDGGNADRIYAGYDEMDGLDQLTNNVAEYFAVLVALDWTERKHSTDVMVRLYSNSQVVVQQLRGGYSVRQDHLKELHEEVRDLLEEFRGWHIERVSAPHSRNIRQADRLAKDAARGEAR